MAFPCPNAFLAMQSKLVITFSFALHLALAADIAAAAGAGASRAEAPRDARSGDVVAFCRTHPDLDDPGATFFGASYAPGTVPRQIEDQEASKWRCMGGKVLMCSDSADGDSCSKKDASRKPGRILQAFCAENPSSAFIPRYAQAYSSSTWRCDRRKPAIVATASLDRRGFMRAMWIPYIVRHGVAARAPEFPDPR
jgi:hypothetical protein